MSGSAEPEFAHLEAKFTIDGKKISTEERITFGVSYSAREFGKVLGPYRLKSLPQLTYIVR